MNKSHPFIFFVQIFGVGYLVLLTLFGKNVHILFQSFPLVETKCSHVNKKNLTRAANKRGATFMFSVWSCIHNAQHVSIFFFMLQPQISTHLMKNVC